MVEAEPEVEAVWHGWHWQRRRVSSPALQTIVPTLAPSPGGGSTEPLQARYRRVLLAVALIRSPPRRHERCPPPRCPRMTDRRPRRRCSPQAIRSEPLPHVAGVDQGRRCIVSDLAAWLPPRVVHGGGNLRGGGAPVAARREGPPLRDVGRSAPPGFMPCTVCVKAVAREEIDGLGRHGSLQTNAWGPGAPRRR